jgi:hypothetical protein
VKFSETIKHSDPDLIVSRRHDAWVVRNDAHPVYTPNALEFARKWFTAKDRVRKGTVSASALGECGRAQQFTYLGMIKLPPDEKNAAKMQNGSFMHLRWQMEGLSDGWLKQAEVPVPENPYRLAGTLDGVLYEDSVLELKSINLHGFSRVQTFGPLHEHLYQMATYMLTTEREKGVFIYECKDNQEYKEIIVSPNDVPLQQAELRAQSMHTSIEKKELEEPLSNCIDRTGWRYHSCPYRDRCLLIHNWEDVA